MELRSTFSNQPAPGSNRRKFLARAGGGVGALALSWLMHRDTAYASTMAPHFAPRAKCVIFMFMVGGPSPIDLFDPKPALEQWRGKPLPESIGRPMSQFTKGNESLLPSSRVFKRHGQSGMWFSDLLPNLAKCADDICFLKSCWSTSTIHAPAMYELHSGRTLMGYPSLGSWATYGLGSVSDNLPAYCVLPQPEGVPEGGAPARAPASCRLSIKAHSFEKGVVRFSIFSRRKASARCSRSKRSTSCRN